MPIGKKIYDTMMGRFEERKRRRKTLKPEVAEEKVILENTPIVKPPMKHIEPTPRKVSPLEGMPAVNGKSGPDIVEKAVQRPRSKIPTYKAGDAAILPGDLIANKKVARNKKKEIKKPERKCSKCKKTGHTSRTCKMREI